MRRFLLLTGLVLTLVAACVVVVANRQSLPSSFPSLLVQRIRPGENTDLANRGDWTRLTVRAAGYVPRIKWISSGEGFPSRLMLAAADPAWHRAAAWKRHNAPRLIMLGFDGMTDRLFREGLARHELPAFEALLERGAVGRLHTCCEANSPVVWSTIYSGMPPEKHGIEGFVTRAEKTGEPIMYTWRQVRVPRLWDILLQRGQKSVLANLLLLNPVQDAVGLFPDLTGRVLTIWKRIFRVHPRLTVVYHRESDYVSHQWWHDYDPAPFRAAGWSIDPEEIEFDGPRLAQAYRNLDIWVAAALVMAGPDTIVLINSDHGFGDAIYSDRAVLANGSELTRLTAPPGFRSCGMAPAGEVLFCADPQTNPRFFADQLRQARTPAGGLLFAKVEDRSQPEFDDGGSRLVAIHAYFNPRVMKDSFENDQPILIGERNIFARSFLFRATTSGDHRDEGLIFLAGAGIRPGATFAANASVYDVMPTALAILGLPIARDMPGRVLNEVFVTPPQPTYLATYGGLTTERADQPASPRDLEALRTLSYLN